MSPNGEGSPAREVWRGAATRRLRLTFAEIFLCAAGLPFIGIGTLVILTGEGWPFAAFLLLGAYLSAGRLVVRRWNRGRLLYCVGPDTVAVKARDVYVWNLRDLEQVAFVRWRGSIGTVYFVRIGEHRMGRVRPSIFARAASQAAEVEERMAMSRWPNQSHLCFLDCTDVDGAVNALRGVLPDSVPVVELRRGSSWLW